MAVPNKRERVMDKKSSASGNWTRVTRVTGGYTNHYTNADLLIGLRVNLSFKFHILSACLSQIVKLQISFRVFAQFIDLDK